jgi:hypothetical protein
VEVGELDNLVTPQEKPVVQVGLEVIIIKLVERVLLIRVLQEVQVLQVEIILVEVEVELVKPATPMDKVMEVTD